MKLSREHLQNLKPQLLAHYGWGAEEFSEYLSQEQFQLFTCPQAALLSFLNLPHQTMEESQETYRKLTQFPLDEVQSTGDFKSWMRQVFEHLTSDFGDILTIDQQTYYVIFNDSL